MKRGLLRRTKENDGIEDVKKVVKQAKCAKTGMEAKVQCARGGGDQQRKRRRLNTGRPLPGQPLESHLPPNNTNDGSRTSSFKELEMRRNIWSWRFRLQGIRLLLTNKNIIWIDLILVLLNCLKLDPAIPRLDNQCRLTERGHHRA